MLKHSYFHPHSGWFSVFLALPCQIQLTEVVNDMAESQLLSAIRDRNISAIFYWLNHRHSAYSNKLEITAKVKDETLSPEQEELIKKALEHASLIMKGKNEQTTE